jgi:hypothetical protein
MRQTYYHIVAYASFYMCEATFGSYQAQWLDYPD